MCSASVCQGLYGNCLLLLFWLSFHLFYPHLVFSLLENFIMHTKCFDQTHLRLLISSSVFSFPISCVHFKTQVSLVLTSRACMEDYVLEHAASLSIPQHQPSIVHSSSASMGPHDSSFRIHPRHCLTQSCSGLQGQIAFLA